MTTKYERMHAWLSSMIRPERWLIESDSIDRKGLVAILGVNHHNTPSPPGNLLIEGNQPASFSQARPCERL